jgi:hypothetical protein
MHVLYIILYIRAREQPLETKPNHLDVYVHVQCIMSTNCHSILVAISCTMHTLTGPQAHYVYVHTRNLHS